MIKNNFQSEVKPYGKIRQNSVIKIDMHHNLMKNYTSREKKTYVAMHA